MAIGTSRRTGFAREVMGWGAFFTTIKTSAIVGATSLDLVGQGGGDSGSAPVTAGMKVVFLEDLTETPKTITAVNVTGGNATLTIGALTNAQAAGKKVAVGYFADSAILLDSFSSNLNKNKWSPMPYTGTRAKNVGRRSGRTEAEGSLEFMARPETNAALIAKGVGFDSVTGSSPTSASTLSAAAAVGDTQLTLTSATGYVVNDVIQVGANPTAECRKITSVATNVVHFANPLLYAHANGEATAVVVAPFTHDVPSAKNNLPTVAFEDYVPYDGATNASVTGSAYYIPGAMFKSVKVETQAEQGAKISIDYSAQDKVEIPASSALTIPSDPTVYSFDQLAVAVNGSQMARITEFSLEVDNDLQTVFAFNNSTRAYCIKAGQQEVKGSFKFYEDDASQSTFWSALQADTQISLDWTMTDAATGDLIHFSVPKVTIDELQDSDFAPGDLVYGSVNFTAVYDSTSGEQVHLTIKNSDPLNY